MSPWKDCSVETTRDRPVAARPSLSAASTASAPELVNRTRASRAGVRLSSSSARSPGNSETPSCTDPGVSSSSVSIERRPDPGIVPPGVEHPEAPEHVEEAVPVRVVEVLPFGARPHAVEADRLQHPHELRVDPARVEVVVLTGASFQELPDHERSVSP